jgi:GTP-binding protein EngB required for normal cell division
MILIAAPKKEKDRLKKYQRIYQRMIEYFSSYTESEIKLIETKIDKIQNEIKLKNL